VSGNRKKAESEEATGEKNVEEDYLCGVGPPSAARGELAIPRARSRKAMCCPRKREPSVEKESSLVVVGVWFCGFCVCVGGCLPGEDIEGIVATIDRGRLKALYLTISAWA